MMKFLGNSSASFTRTLISSISILLKMCFRLGTSVPLLHSTLLSAATVGSSMLRGKYYRKTVFPLIFIFISFQFFTYGYFGEKGIFGDFCLNGFVEVFFHICLCLNQCVDAIQDDDDLRNIHRKFS